MSFTYFPAQGDLKVFLHTLYVKILFDKSGKLFYFIRVFAERAKGKKFTLVKKSILRTSVEIISLRCLRRYIFIILECTQLIRLLSNPSYHTNSCLLLYSYSNISFRSIFEQATSGRQCVGIFSSKQRYFRSVGLISRKPLNQSLLN